MSQSEIIIEKFHSKSLENNPLGDPHIRNVPIYLPPGYQDNDTRYPVLYLLAGFSGRGTMMLNDSLWDETIQEQMDRLIETQLVRPMILVLPDGSTRYGGSQYINSSATGQYEDHILELVQYVDSKYRTLNDRNFRAVVGKSSGGYGATILGMHHPDIFGLVADMSGDKYFELCYKPDFVKWLHYFARVGDRGIKEMLANPGAIRPKSGDFFGALSISAMAACYSPNLEKPGEFEMPIHPITGELRDDIWARWEAHDPVNLIHEYAASLRSLRLLYFECGSRDEYNLHYGARIFAQRLRNHGIPYVYEEFDDGHRGLNYRYDMSFAYLSNAMPNADQF